ncbi:helicase-related protein [Methanopyrus sp.]
MKTLWTLDHPGERPRPARERLGSLCPKLPDVRAYEHQVETAEAFRSGDNVLLVAGTGAGKTEAALAAVWEDALPAVFVYPTKALARDQLERLERYGFDVMVADGDHPGWRQALESRDPEIVLTNPHMLWYHARRDGPFWEFVRRRARALVWDEVHHYDPRRANLLLGLIRALRDKRHLLMSGTVGKPGRLAAEVRRVTRRRVEIVRGRGRFAPRTYWAYLPRSGSETVRWLARFAVDPSVRTIVYANSRATAERLARALRSEGLPVAVHHGALPKDERRSVERAFKRGDLRLVVTVRTLEVGIDVGSVGRVVHLGLPPRVSDFLQREGRAGRRDEPAESHLLAVDGWSSFVLERRERFERAYLRGELESVPARASNPLSREPADNPVDEFYGRGRYRVVDHRGRTLVDNVSPFDVVHYYAPGRTFELSGRTWIVAGTPRGGVVPAMPVDRYDAKIARLVERGWWTVTVTRARPVGEEDLGVGKVRVTWLATLLVPPPESDRKPEVLEEGRWSYETRTYYVRLRDDRLGTEVGKGSAEYALHALTHALRVTEGYPPAHVRHAVDEGSILLYELPAAVLPHLDWEAAVREAGRTRLDPGKLRLPTCPWPTGAPRMSRPLVRRYLLRLLGLLERLSLHVRGLSGGKVVE